MRRFMLAMAAGAALALCLSAAASGADRIYWGNLYGNNISFANLDGSGGTDLPIDPAALDGPMGTAIDPRDGKIYWANFGNLGGPGSGRSIGVANLDGSDAHIVPIAGVPVVSPHGVAVDPAADKLYWTNQDESNGNSWIGYANLDGSNGGYFNPGAATMSDPRGLALDKAAGKLYWANHGANRISVANLDGSGGSDIPTGAATVDDPEGVAIAPAQNRLYYGNYVEPPDPLGETISWVNLDGSGGANLDTDPATRVEPHGVAIDPTVNRIYWANFDAPDPGGGTGVISSASLDGGFGADLPTAGATKDRPSMPVLLKTPVPVKAPDISGKAKPGAELHCSQGGWAADFAASLLWREPSHYTYAWRKNGQLIDGETSASLTTHSIGEYKCAVGGINDAGSAYQESAAHAAFRLGRAHRNIRKGIAKLVVKVPGPGWLSVRGHKIVNQRLAGPARANGALGRKVKSGRIRLLIKPHGKAKRHLARRGRLKVRLRVSYRPKGGEKSTQREVFWLIER